MYHPRVNLPWPLSALGSAGTEIRNGWLREYMVHGCAEDSLGLWTAGMTSMSRRLAVADEVYIVLEFYKRYNIPREL